MSIVCLYDDFVDHYILALEGIFEVTWAIFLLYGDDNMAQSHALTCLKSHSGSWQGQDSKRGFQTARLLLFP